MRAGRRGPLGVFEHVCWRRLSPTICSAQIRGPDGLAVPEAAASASEAPPTGASYARRGVTLACGTAAQLTVSAASQRDAAGAALDVTGRAEPAILAASIAALSPAQRQSLRVQHRAWWTSWWNASSVDLGPEWHLLEKNYYTMMCARNRPSVVASSARASACGGSHEQ